MGANQDQQDEVADDQVIVDDSETVDVPVENGPWEDSEDFFERYLY